MKTYNEMAENALERIREREKALKKRKKILIGTLTPALCICIAVLTGFGLHRNTLDAVPSPQANITETEEHDIIYINENADISDGALKMNIGLKWEDFVKMSPEELEAYYGTKIFPDIPADLKMWDSEEDSVGYGIFRRNKGKGEAYYDHTVWNYSNAAYTRDVNIEIEKGRIPYVDFASPDEEDYQKSVLSGCEVYLDHTEGGYYHARFMHNGVGFFLTADGLTEEEFISTVRSLLK